MNLLIEHGGPYLDNFGDMAMLQSALERFAHWSPVTTLQVLAQAPARLATICPQARHISSRGRTYWSDLLPTRFSARFSTASALRGDAFARLARYRQPIIGNLLLQLKLWTRPALKPDLRAFQHAMAQADCVVATGGGYLNDEFPRFAMLVLNTLEWAIHLQKPTVLFGQGIGPLRNQRLLARAKAILPHVDLIALREKRTSLPRLHALGVAPERILVTGDDAVNIAYRVHADALGKAVGVNLRQAPYAGLTPHHIDTVGKSLRQVTAQIPAPLLPIPISELANDQMTIEALLAAAGPVANQAATPPLDTPLQVIQQISRCRVVMTGSYHAGVFALAQGIPVVSLAHSAYYMDKFHGLADQFGVGCTVLHLDDKALAEKLTSALSQAWATADQTRAPLLAAARRQMAASEQAYAHAREIFQNKV